MSSGALLWHHHGQPEPYRDEIMDDEPRPDLETLQRLTDEFELQVEEIKARVRALANSERGRDRH